MWSFESLCQTRADWTSFKFLQKTERLHFSASFTQKLKMIRCCLARAWASSSTTELLVNGEGHRCRWFIYSPSEAFKLLKSISCADKLTYWSKATKPRHLLVRSALRTLGWKKDCVFIGVPSWGEGALKVPAESVKKCLFFLWLQIVKKHPGGWLLQDARSWKLNFGLRDEKSRLHVSDTKATSYDWQMTERISKSGQDRESGVEAPAGSTSRPVSRCRHRANMRNKSVSAQLCRIQTSDSTFYLNHEAERDYKIWTSYRPFRARGT